MKLLSTDLSPFAGRVRAQIYAKGLSIEIAEPNPPLRSDGFKASYALGKIPVLLLEDDTYLSESSVIMHYLEDIHPEPSLRPTRHIERAHMGLFQAFADNHLRDQLFPLFALLMNPKGGTDPNTAIKAMTTEFGKFDRQLAEIPSHETRNLHIGDIALAMTMYFALAVPAVFGGKNLLTDFARLSGWWEWVKTQSGVDKALAETDIAFKEIGNGN